MNTPNRTVRIVDALWLPAKAITEARGESIAEHIFRPALEEYIARHSAPSCGAVDEATGRVCARVAGHRASRRGGGHLDFIEGEEW